MEDREKIIKEFVKQFYKEMLSHKRNCTDRATSGREKSLVSKLTNDLNLSETQFPVFDKLIGALLTDVFYTILLGLDGSTAIGDYQRNYKIIDDKGNYLSGSYIEVYAYEYFHDNLYQKEENKD